MCSDILPTCVQEYLDDFETGLCTPLILLIIFCTIHLLLRQTLKIICAARRIMKKRSSAPEQKPSPFMRKLKGMFACPGDIEMCETDTECQPGCIELLRSTDSCAWIDAGVNDDEECEDEDS